MKAFIKSTTSLSSLGRDEATATHGFRAKEPAYAEYINPAELRRMSRLMKMGVYAANRCVKEAGLTKVDAITVGTGLGGFECFDKFERSIIQNEESTLSPTPFLQSLHNSVSGQIALGLKCYGYNMTYVHRGFSFETALLDALMLLQETSDVHQVLVGGLDELTLPYAEMLEDAGYVKKNAVGTGTGPLVNSTGITPGEGAAFFLLSDQASEQSLAEVWGVRVLFEPAHEGEIVQALQALLTENKLECADIDLLVLGNCGDVALDRKITKLAQTTFPQTPKVYFKNTCGEYHTAAAFGFWMAIQALQPGWQLPDLTVPARKPMEHVVLVNQYRDTHYSCSLLSKPSSKF